MSGVSDNPCNACSTNQHCCSRLSGLFLSEQEFDGLFKQFQHKLIVRRSGRIVRVYAADGGACPYWNSDGCRIYADRAIDCRLFPYIPLHVIERRGMVKMVYHSRSDCPQKETLIPLFAEGEVHALLQELGKKMYGESKRIIVQQENGTVRRVLNRVEAAISRRLYRRR